VFVETALTLKRRIDLMLSLPIDTLAGMSMQHALNQIGRS